MDGPLETTNMPTLVQSLHAVYNEWPRTQNDREYARKCFIDSSGAKKVLRFLRLTKTYRQNAETDIVKYISDARTYAYHVLIILAESMGVKKSLIQAGVCEEVTDDIEYNMAKEVG